MGQREKVTSTVVDTNDRQLPFVQGRLDILVHLAVSLKNNKSNGWYYSLVADLHACCKPVEEKFDGFTASILAGSSSKSEDSKNETGELFIKSAPAYSSDAV